MAHGVSEVLGEGNSVVKMVKHQSPQRQQQLQHSQQQQHRSVMGSRRIFPPQFKVKVLDSYRNDEDCKLNQRATARKFNIHRRQIQKWLQNEKTLRDSCPDSGSSSSSSGCSSGTASAVTTPAASPPQDLLLLQQQQHHHHHNHHQQSSEPTPASPALNLSLARLHGDELAVQPPPPQQQQQPPPPPLQSSSSSGSSAVAAQALAAATAAAHQHQQAPDYRFRVSPTAIALAAAAAAAAAATGYPDFKDGLPIARQPPPPTAPSASSHHHHHQQHHFVPTAAAAAGVHRQPGNYPMLEQLYQPPPQLVYNPHREQQPLSPPITPHHRYEPLDIHQPRYHFTKAIEPKLDSSLSSPSSSSSPASLGSLNPEDELQLRRRASLISPVKIKTERASPDSLAVTPGPCESSSSSIISSTSSPGAVSPSGASSISSIQEACSNLSRLCNLKRELPDEEEEHHRQRTSSLSESCSPAPSQPDHLENLPPSPDRSNASSDSEMEQSPGGGSDLARRRSFSLRFKLDVLDAFHRDKAVAGNQRATARKFGINRRQVQKWLGQESELRGVIELCGSDNRQRLGPAQEPEESAVDLRTSLAEASPSHSSLFGAGYNCCEYRLGSASPGTAYLDSSLTPPYSTPGCSLSCCSQDAPVQPSYYCYSPGEIADSTASSLKRAALCSQSCCYPPAKRPCIEEIKPAAKDDEQQSEPEQDSPLCLVKPKPDSTGSSSQQQQEPVSSTVPSPPASATPVPTSLATKKDPILFKPYLDNPVSKPSAEESAINNNNNNNCQTVCNLNEQRPVQDLELELKFKLPAKWRAQQQQLQPQQPAYLEAAPVRSAFVRYPSSVHYS